MGNFKIEIEAVGDHGSDRTAKQGEPLNITGGTDKQALDFVGQLASTASIVSAKLTHWPDTTPIIDDLKAGVRAASDFHTTFQPEPILQFFSFHHLADEKLRDVSRGFAHAAYAIVASLPRNAERTVALRKLLEAKDAAVRAALAK